MLMSSSQRLCGCACGRHARSGLSICGFHWTTHRDHLSGDCCAIRRAHRHCLRKYAAAQSCTFAFSRCSSAIWVARLIKSGHGSSTSSSLSSTSCSKTVLLEMLLVTSSVEGLLSLSLCWVVSCRRGVPMISLIIRRWVRLSVIISCFVSVQEAHAYVIVGVTVASKSRNREYSG